MFTNQAYEPYSQVELDVFAAQLKLIYQDYFIQEVYEPIIQWQITTIQKDFNYLLNKSIDSIDSKNDIYIMEAEIKQFAKEDLNSLRKICSDSQCLTRYQLLPEIANATAYRKFESLLMKIYLKAGGNIVKNKFEAQGHPVSDTEMNQVLTLVEPTIKKSIPTLSKNYEKYRQCQSIEDIETVINLGHVKARTSFFGCAKNKKPAKLSQKSQKNVCGMF